MIILIRMIPLVLLYLFWSNDLFEWFCLDNNSTCFLSECPASIRSKGSHLQGCTTQKEHEVAHPHMICKSSARKMSCGCSVFQNDQRTQSCRFGVCNLPHFWKTVYKIQSFKYIFPTLHQTMSIWVTTIWFCSSERPLKTTNMQQEIVTVPRTVNSREIISSCNWS